MGVWRKMSSYLGLLLALSLLSPVHPARLSGPYVESYWESWNFKDFPDDFAAKLEDVPASPVGASSGVNIIDLSFGDYSPGLGGLEAPEEIIRAGIEAIHAAGGLVKIAYGGALYSMSQYIQSVDDAKTFCKGLKETFDEYGVDGLDLDIEDGGTSAEIQAAVIKECRKELGEEALQSTADVLDAVNVMAYDIYWTGYNFEMDIAGLNDAGMTNDKIVWGLMPGHHDAGNEYTSLEDARAAARYVKESGLAGLMTWSLNRDTDRRSKGNGGDNLCQTGQPDATFVNALSQALN